MTVGEGLGSARLRVSLVVLPLMDLWICTLSEWMYEI